MSYNFNALKLGSLFFTATAGLFETFVREKCCFYLLAQQNKYKIDWKAGDSWVPCQSKLLLLRADDEIIRIALE